MQFLFSEKSIFVPFGEIDTEAYRLANIVILNISEVKKNSSFYIDSIFNKIMKLILQLQPNMIKCVMIFQHYTNMAALHIKIEWNLQYVNHIKYKYYFLDFIQEIFILFLIWKRNV